LASLFRYLEPHVAAGSHVIDADRHHITTAELAVDSGIEESEVAQALLKLKARSDGPDVPLAERGFAPMIFPLFQGGRQAGLQGVEASLSFMACLLV